MTQPTHTATRQPLPEAELDEVTTLVLPEPSPAPVPLDEADPDQAEAIRARMNEIDLTNPSTVIRFGASAQGRLQEISQSMLADMRNKDVGPAGESLREIVSTLRGFSTDEIDPNAKRSFWDRLTGRAAPVARFLARFEDVQEQIDSITRDLENHEMKLLRDIKSLDQLYLRTLEFYDELGLYISAGQARIDELDSEILPAAQARMEAAPEDQATLRAQELRDLRGLRDDLERRVHDLRLTRQVTMQSLPSIRLVQENDKSLVTRINSTLVNTVPLWETQLAQAVTIHRSTEAARAVREASDLTNELLTRNAENLRSANAQIRTEAERGVFDITSVREANATLIATIEDSLRIADEGRTRRASAEAELTQMEDDLRRHLAATRAISSPSGATSS